MKKVLFLCILLCSCQSRSFENIYNVQYRGALKLMMHKGDVSAKAELKGLKSLAHVYALGALENLKGEIQIFDGQPYNTIVENGKSVIDSTFGKKATLLVWAQIENWIDVIIPSEIRSFEDLEKFIADSALGNGIPLNEPFPFLLNGKVRSLDWHIIDWKDGDMEHSHEKHITSGLHGTLENTEVEILGFYSKHHRAIFTHHTTNIHSHFKTQNSPYGGHVDDLQLGKNMILKLPGVKAQYN